MNMITVEEKTESVGVFQENFLRGLDKLRFEIKSYPNEWNVWIKEGNIGSSAGSICLYLINTFDHSMALLNGIELEGKINEPFVDPSRDVLLQKIEFTKALIEDALHNLTDESLEQDFPIAFRDKQVSTSTYLLYLLTELHYRLGQINYHRRLI
jgi:hypothetical protein